MLRTILATLLFLPSVALAGDTILPGESGDDLWNQLEHMPPHKSTDFAFGVSYGEIGAWRGDTGPWLGFGLHFAYGVHLGDSRTNRVGFGVAVKEEGPFPEYYSLFLSPSVEWDRVAHHIQLGASLGPSLAMNGHSGIPRSSYKVAPTGDLAVRVGYSQAWSRVQKRMFVVAEPRLRWVAGQPEWLVGVFVGSGKGW